jgi:cellulose biosynthesis protein BcsE
MNDSSNTIQGMPAVRLGIHGLPNLTNCMNPGGLYAMIAETPPARFPILATSLTSAIADGIPCSVVVPAHPEQFVERIRSFGQLDMNALLTAGHLNVFEMQAEFPKKMFRFGADSFVRELEQLFDVPNNSFMLFDQADELLALHDITLALDQIDILRKWFEDHNITALLVFSRANAAHIATINALMDSLTGMSRLGSDKNGLELVFDYWQSPEGTIAGRGYPLVRLESGIYEATSRPVAEEGQVMVRADGEAEAPLPEEDPHYFYMDPDLGNLAQQLPGIWQRVDTVVGMMHATQGIRTATVILSFQRDTRIRQLAEAVHTLRLTLGKHARIIVQEKNASLRYQNEALLLRLGVSLVVHRDVAPSRLPLLIESLRGQVFSRDVNINFEAALASVLPTRLRGYLLPARFTKEVEVVLDRAETLSIPYALVIGRAKDPSQIGQVIGASNMSRAGDLISSDGERYLIFLNACPQAVLLQTLKRILGRPAEEILEEAHFMVSRDDIQMELGALAIAAERQQLPDYSALIPAQPEIEEAPEPQGPAQEPMGSMHAPVDTYSSRPNARAPAPATAMATPRPAPMPMQSMPAAAPQALEAARPAPVPATQTPQPGTQSLQPAKLQAMPQPAPAKPAPAMAAPLMSAPAAPAVREVAAARHMPEPEETSSQRFAYSGSAVENKFGKREAPRAVRRSAATDKKEETASPADH